MRDIKGLAADLIQIKAAIFLNVYGATLTPTITVIVGGLLGVLAIALANAVNLFSQASLLVFSSQ